MTSRFTLAAPFGAALMIAAGLAVTSLPARAQNAGAGFFVTSTSIGNGGNLGGLAGADNHCQELAQAAGIGTTSSGVKTWRAYLSTQAADGKPAVKTRATASARGRGRTSRAR